LTDSDLCPSCKTLGLWKANSKDEFDTDFYRCDNPKCRVALYRDKE